MKQLTKNQELEVTARVNFILTTFFEGLENSINFHHRIACESVFDNNMRLYDENMQRIKFRKEVLSMLRKEMTMPLPVDYMYLKNRRNIADEFIEKFTNISAIKGTREYHVKRERVVNNVLRLMENMEDITSRMYNTNL